MKNLPQKSMKSIKKYDLPFVIRNYTYMQFIGKGGFASVYLIVENNCKSSYVAKVMHIDLYNDDNYKEENEDPLKKAMPEINALTKLNHPNIIRLYDHFVIGNELHMILEYCSNGSISDEIKKNPNGLSFKRFLFLSTQIVKALAVIHSSEIAHRDVKPGNILLDQYNRAKIADFGLSSQTQKGSTENTFCGSSIYTAPEIYMKQNYDPFKADIWSLGVTFAVMIQGRSPWICDNHGALKKLISSGKTHLSKRIPQEIVDVIQKMIIVDPEQRITADELANLPLFKLQTELPTPSQIRPQLSSSVLVMELRSRSRVLPRTTTPALLPTIRQHMNMSMPWRGSLMMKTTEPPISYTMMTTNHKYRTSPNTHMPRVTFCNDFCLV